MSAARIEEEVVVTEDGCRIITRFPGDELLVAGRTYVRGADLAEPGGNGATDGRSDGERRGEQLPAGPGY